MADGLVLWSGRPIHHKKVLMDMAKAAYDSGIDFYAEGCNSYDVENVKCSDCKEVTLLADTIGHDSMIFHISDYNDQVHGTEKWADTLFVSPMKGNKNMPILYRLAASEGFDSEIAFYFTYHYLKLNSDHFVSISGFLLDWEYLDIIFSEGFVSGWINVENYR